MISIKCTYKNLLNLQKLISSQNTLRVATKTGTELYFVKTKTKKILISYYYTIISECYLRKFDIEKKNFFRHWIIQIKKNIPLKVVQLNNFINLFGITEKNFCIPRFTKACETGELNLSEVTPIILCKKSPHSELFWSAFLSHFPAFKLNAGIKSECWKMREKCGPK